MMTSLTVPLTYPLTAADEQRAINRCAVSVSVMLHTFSKDYSGEWLERTLRQCLREGALSIAIKAVEAADKGDNIADAALRDVGAELLTGVMQKRDLAPGHLQIISYLQRVGNRPPLKRKPGRYAWSDHWVQNLGICILIRLTSMEFGVPETRSRETRRASRRPSAISIVTAALARNRIHLDEQTIQQKIWFGLPGELSRQQVPTERLVEMLRAAVSP
jgi:hypothetical protein